MDSLERKYPRIYLRYKRKVIAHPEGAVVHDGDCDLFNVHLGICTCGLHHALLCVNEGDTEKIYPNYFEEHDGKAYVETLLREKEEGGIWTQCSECEGKGGIGMTDCGTCKGKGLTPFEMPEPLSDEKIKDIFKDAGWQESSGPDDRCDKS